MLPPIGSMFVSLLKDTSLLSVIGVAELMNTGQNIGAITFRNLEVLIVVAGIYFLMTYPIARWANRLHDQMSAHSWPLTHDGVRKVTKRRADPSSKWLAFARISARTKCCVGLTFRCTAGSRDDHRAKWLRQKHVAEMPEFAGDPDIRKLGRAWP